MKKTKPRKAIALTFLILFSIQFFAPVTAFALTSGPSQPEMTKFAPAGNTDMVDLFTGDFKYNIPLMEVGGYPVNLSYQSGTGMEEEGSWVGIGWTLNPGAVNRNLRGLPDDFDGDKGDNIIKEYDKKPFKKVGGTLIIKPTLFGWEAGKANFRLSVYKDNYYGIGASTAAGLNVSLFKNSYSGLNAGLDIESDTREGVTITPSASVDATMTTNKEEDNVTGSLSGSLRFNSRAGLKDFTLGASFSTSTKFKDESGAVSGEISGSTDRSAVQPFGQTYTPTTTNNYSNYGYTFNFDLGASLFGGYLGLGGSGFVYGEKLLDKLSSTPAYGYLNYLKGRHKKNVLIDFNREKDGVFLKNAPAIAAPVATQDYFMATGQAGSNQFRPYYSGNYITFDKEHYNITDNTNLGVTLGFGNGFQGGARLENSGGDTRTKEWGNNNEYLTHADYIQSNRSNEESVYFKRVGEKTQFDRSFYDLSGGDAAKKVGVTIAANTRSAKATSFLNGPAGSSTPIAVNDHFQKNTDEREIKNHLFTYLTALSASEYGLDPQIRSFTHPGNVEEFQLVPRIGDARKAHHMSEVTVTDNGGKRMVYGLPVYNNFQEEYTFSVEEPTGEAKEIAHNTGVIAVPYENDKIQHNFGRDNLFTKTITPGYATSFLLTGILSPDYVDIKNDGITDDDLGTAVKFNYSRNENPDGQPNGYRWRAPFKEPLKADDNVVAIQANYNEGYISDKKDNKASIVYGEKELWNLHSIESKTMIAFFITSDREDALGVKDMKGEKEDQIRQKKLDLIKLYSKADWYKDPDNAIPIKTVHFEYDYSLYPGVPNNTGNAITKLGQPTDDDNSNINLSKGKLTLKKIYFTFGTSSRGTLNPYSFSYDLMPIDYGEFSLSDNYAERQTDRWGTYKQPFYNRFVDGNPIFTNAEYPYSLQKNNPQAGISSGSWKTMIDQFASKWQLNQIITPAGGTISVGYESDDYAYVQNKQAMQMCTVSGYSSDDDEGSNFITANRLNLTIPTGVEDADEFKAKYLTDRDGTVMKQMYFRFLVDIDNKGDQEYVSGYSDIDENSIIKISETEYSISISNNGQNPIAKAAWQLLYSDLPQFAYENYDNSEVGDGEAAIRSILTSLGNLGEFRKSPDQRAKDKGFASNIDLNKSMVRLYVPDGMKTGGGSRVRTIQVSDQWNEMAMNGNASLTTGQYFDYTTKNSSGDVISSGVAAYEPATGNEENPFHEPISFTEQVKWSNDRYHFIEKPFCEGHFPAANVGYSKVTVYSTGSGYENQKLEHDLSYTGYVENEYYTAKDFPTLVDYLPLQSIPVENSIILKLFTGTSINKVVNSQGFKIELNDMHGKEKSVKIFDKKGTLITSSAYFYSEKDPTAETRELNNEIPQMDKAGSFEEHDAGIDYDFITDMRESISENTGTSVGAYYGATIYGVYPIPFFSLNYNTSRSVAHYHSASAVKVIQKYGILKKTVTTKYGSTIEAENLIWDGHTGEVVLTQTENEFGKYTYAFTYPAYMAYDRMGHAYQNVGAIYQGMTIGENGVVSVNEEYGLPDFVTGDELIPLTGGAGKFWIIFSDESFRAIDQYGEFIPPGTFTAQVLRSGRRNMLGAGTGTVICMNDPRTEDGQIDLSVDKRILDSKATIFKDEWAVPVNYENETGSLTVYPETEYHDKGEATSPNFVIVDDDAKTVRCGVNELGAYIDQNYSSLNTPARTFTSFGRFFGTLPTNAEIVSAKLSLYASPAYEMYGNNEAYLKRVIEDKDCTEASTNTNEPVNWDNQPQVTEVNRVYLPTSNYAHQDYPNLDVTAMFNDWFTTKDVNEFRIRINLIHEYTHEDKSLIFDGATGVDLPKLVITYRIPGSCVDPSDKKINPYVTGLLGNWRPLSDYVYTVNRKQPLGSVTQLGSTDIRNSGYYSKYTPFWTFTEDGLVNSIPLSEDIPANDKRWVWSNKSVYFDQKGNEVENVDALKRYNSALFGYQQSMAIAVAANARNNEIAFDGFEDYGFDVSNGATVTCPLPRHLDFGLVRDGNNWTAEGAAIVSENAHSGNYCLRLNGDLTIEKPPGNSEPFVPILQFDNEGRYLLLSNELANGFAPILGKKYLLSLWINDHAPNLNKIQNLNLTINGSSLDLDDYIVPVVEGWKRLEISFEAGANFALEFSGSVDLDDIRILPKDGQLNTYVYNEKTLRLMAQLDENNFATFFEYDEQGTPIRVKKETERGIMTLKENRQSLKSEMPSVY